MRTGIQSPNIPNIWNPLDLADANPELPEVDTSLIQVVYDIDPAYVSLTPLLLSESQSVAAASASFIASTTMTERPGSAALDPNLVQIYHHINTEISGGTNTPLQVGFFLRRGGSTDILDQFAHVNAGRANAGALLVPAGWDLQITCQQGGAGDSFTAFVNGYQVAAGLPVPVVPYTSRLP